LEASNSLAPIVLFVYNRPWHTIQTLEALERNLLADKSHLIIFCDGPKSNATNLDLNKINQVRSIVKSKSWCGSMEIIESAVNKGLANSIIEGVTEIVKVYGKIIVLEDDLVTSSGFLQFMNDALKLYEQDENVMHVSGYTYPIKFRNRNAFFVKTLTCWGWATWARAWDKYENDATILLNRIEKQRLIKEFNLNNYSDFLSQLELNASQSINTWAVKWYASWFLNNGISLLPPCSFVQNIGFDGTGEHCFETNIFQVELMNSIKLKKIKIKQDFNSQKRIIHFYKNKFYTKVSENSIRTRYNKFKRLALDLLRITCRFLLYKFLPELRFLEKNSNNLEEIIKYGILSKINQSIVSQKTALNKPYIINDVIIGDYSYIARNCFISHTNIGKFCSIGPNLVCGWGIHPTSGMSTSPMFYSTLKQNGYSLSQTNKIEERKQIQIGNDVFIGANVTILDGVVIGNGAIIGAGSVVSKNIPPYSIAYGNPIEIRKMRFDDETIQKLMKMEWWNSNDSELVTIEKYFFDVNSYILLNDKSNSEQNET
jgi:acetyltransferase-like isoleucine patch superfamily enzyme